MTNPAAFTPTAFYRDGDPENPVFVNNVQDVFEFPHCRLMYRNFEGRPTRVNPNGGKRACSIRLDEEAALILRDQFGLYVKQNEVRSEGEQPDWHMPIEARYDPKFAVRDPKIVLITTATNGRPVQTLLTEATIGIIDHSDITDCNVTVRVRNWNVMDKSGCKAYLRAMDITVYQDAVEQRIANMNFDDGDTVEAF